MPNFPTAQQLRQFLRANDSESIRRAFEGAHPYAIAEALSWLDADDLWAVLRRFDPPLDADVFSHLSENLQIKLATRNNAREVAMLIDRMPSDDRAHLVQQLTEVTREKILGAMDQPRRLEVERLATYAEGTVGAMMSTEFVTLGADQTAGEAISQLRLQAARKEMIYYNYVVDAQGRLIGIVSLRDLLLADPSSKLTDLMHREVITVSADADREQGARKIREYDLLALPVVQGDNRLVGIITVDDVLDVEVEETTADFHKMAPIGLMKVNLKEAGVRVLYQARVIWLVVLVFMNIFSGAGIAFFEDTLAAMISLAFFLPLLIDSGGNAGSQAATLMVRALATGQVKVNDWLRLLGKEIAVALTLGVTMAVGVALIASVRAPDIVFVVTATMVLVVLFGSLVGMSLPFILTRLRLDPATASAPLITSIADIGGVLIYFSIASWWLGDVMKEAAGA